MIAGGEIRIRKLVKTYGGAAAVDAISLDVSAGEFVTLLGASGSGKTTTLMMIAGFVDADSGTIEINGRDVLKLPPERRDLGVVFQSYALFPHLNVFDNVAFPLRVRRVAKDEISRRVEEVLELVGLGAYRQRRISQLSGGQQQRVALARSLVFSPPVLLMDEPMGALDRQLRDQLQTEIKRIQRDLGVTVVYVTHDQEEALALSDRIAIMQHGQVAQIGTPDEVYINPVSPFVARFLGESNLFPANLVGSDGREVSVAPNGGEGAPFKGYLAAGLPPPKGEASLLAMIRPEAVDLASPADPITLDNSIEGRVELREFMGTTIRYLIASRLGTMLVRVPRLSASARFEVGGLVRMSWQASNMIVFCEDPHDRPGNV